MQLVDILRVASVGDVLLSKKEWSTHTGSHTTFRPVSTIYAAYIHAEATVNVLHVRML